MRGVLRIVMALLLAAAVAAHPHHHRRNLAQVQEQNNGNGQGNGNNNGNGNGGGNGNGNGNKGNSNGKGPRFNFPRGTAKGFLDKLKADKVKDMLDNVNLDDTSALAQVLEDDPDLVSRVSPAPHLSRRPHAGPDGRCKLRISFEMLDCNAYEAFERRAREQQLLASSCQALAGQQQQMQHVDARPWMMVHITAKYTFLLL